jgi:cytochrome P450
MADVLITEDPLYLELYDVRREAQVMGNLVEEDRTAAISALRTKAPVHAGYLRELLNLPEHFRHSLAKGRPGFTALSYAACDAAFRDPKRFSSRIAHHPNDANEQTMGILEMDGPQHRAYRRTIQPKFQMPEALGWWRRRWIDEIVGRLIERLSMRVRAELNLDFCARIPVHTITRAIGMEGNDALTFRDAYVHSSGISAVTPKLRAEAAATVERMLLGLIASRRAQPDDDLVSFLLCAKIKLPDGTVRLLTDREVMFHAKLVMVAGGGTSWRQIGITLWALLTHPDQFEQVKADRSLLDAAIEEALRWNPTAPIFSRLVIEDASLCGVPMAAGSVIELCLGAANRDPSRWDHADAFDMHRPLLSSLAFGMGQHRCLGMNVARVEMSTGISALLDAFPGLRLDPAESMPYLTGGLEQRGVSQLPVLLK